MNRSLLISLSLPLLQTTYDVKPLLMEVFSPPLNGQVQKEEFKQNALKNIAVIQSLGMKTVGADRREKRTERRGD